MKSTPNTAPGATLNTDPKSTPSATPTIEERVRAFLSTCRCPVSALEITRALKMSDENTAPVARALNAMRTLGEVEAERSSGRGAPLVYWLTRAEPETPIAQPTPEPAAVPEPTETPAPTDKTCCNAARVVARTAGVEVAELRAALDAERVRVKQLQADLVAQTEEMEERARRFEALWQDLGKARVDLADRDHTIHDLQSALADKERLVASLRQQNGTPAEPRAQVTRTPRRPFSITGLSGYHAQPGKVTLFLDRRLSARSITLDADRLSALADLARG